MTHFDIALIGSGSVNSFPGPEFADRSLVLIDEGIGPDHVFGGTCLNAGCIPTKMFVHTADVAAISHDAERFGVHIDPPTPHWPSIRDRIFGRIDPISTGGEQYRRDHPDNENLTLLRGRAHFTATHQLTVHLNDGDHEEITADTVVIGAGSRAELPPISGIAQAQPHTSDTIMRIPELPASLLILGSGVVAVETAHIFASLGVAVTIIARSDRVLRSASADISHRLTEVLDQRLTIERNFMATSVERDHSGVHLTGVRDGEPVVLHADQLLVATGRRSNADLLHAEQVGFDVHADGRIAVDPHQRVLRGGEAVPGIWACGDVSSPYQLKHVANHELRVLRHNLLHPGDLRRSDLMPVPYGVFTSPQIAWVGMSPDEARTRPEARVVRQEYGGVAYGWALEDSTGFLDLIVDKETTAILGASMIGPEATSLIQLLIQAMSTGQTARELARTQYWIHPGLPEIIENALLQACDS